MSGVSGINRDSSVIERLGVWNRAVAERRTRRKADWDRSFQELRDSMFQTLSGIAVKARGYPNNPSKQIAAVLDPIPRSIQVVTKALESRLKQLDRIERWLNVPSPPSSAPFRETSEGWRLVPGPGPPSKVPSTAQQVPGLCD